MLRLDDLDDDRPAARPAPRRRLTAPPTAEALRAQLQRTEQALWLSQRRCALLEERVREAFRLSTWGRRQP